MAILDDFEDGDVSEWEVRFSPNGANSGFTASALRSFTGDYAGELYLDGSTAENAVFKRSFAVGKPNRLSAAVNIDYTANSSDADGTQLLFLFRSENDVNRVLCSLDFDNDTVLRTSGSQTAAWATDAWYKIELREIDWNQYTFRLVVTQNGSTVIDESDITFDHLQSFSAVPQEFSTVWFGSNNDTGSVAPQRAFVDTFSEPEPPATPTLSRDATRASEIDLSWTDDSANQSYNLYRAEASGSTVSDYTQIAEVTATAYTDSGLENGERYYYGVTGENAQGESDLSNEIAGTTALPASTPALDTSTIGELGISWSKQDNSSDGEWELYRSEVAGSLGSRIADGLAPPTTSYTDTAVEEGEQYYYTLRRITDHASADAMANAIAALRPLTDIATTPGLRSIDLSWTVQDNSPDGDILLERKPTGGSWSNVTTLDDDTASYADSGLLDGERYRYRLTRRTDHAEAAETSSAATTDLPAPTNLSESNVTASGADLSWAASHNYGDTLVQLKPVGGSWTTVATVSRDTENYPLSMLRNGERYRARVRARTEHTKTTDQ